MIENADYSKMCYNPVGKTESEIREALRVGMLNRVFKSYDGEYTPPEGIHVAISYILLTYDVRSPYRDIYQDSDERKREAARMSGYNMGSKERLEEVFSLLDRSFVELVFDLLRHLNHKEFTLLVSNEELFWQINHNILSMIAEKPADFKDEKAFAEVMDKRSKNLEHAEKILGNIDRIEDKIFKGDTAADKIRKIASSRPEARAHRPNDSR